MDRRTVLCAILGVAVACTACDVVDEPDRLIEVDADSFTFTNKVVLLEEFTGHLCVNCPQGAAVVASLQEWAGGHVIPVSIHCGSYAAVNQVFAEDFTTEAGDAYYNEFEPDAFPSCMMDRTAGDGGVKINSNYDMWQSDLITCAAQAAPVEIELEASCDAAGQLSAKATVTGIYTIDYDVSLQLWLVEDGLVGAQLSQEGIDYDYVHNHVLRGAINGTWGELVGTISAGNSIERSYTYDIGGCVAENCKVVAFVYETASRGNVLQAAEVAL